MTLLACLKTAYAQPKNDIVITNSTLSENSVIADPHENWNRGVFAFNNTLDHYILEPVAIGYDAATPSLFRLIIQNELDFLQSPISIINSALQGDIDVVLHTTGRFLINTVFGGLGTLDAASDFGLKPHREDFGQTLAVWGVPDGGYHITPFLGSMTLRDLGGRVVDIVLNPVNRVGDDRLLVFPAITAVGVVDFRASNIEFLDNLKSSSEDFYTTIKTIYIQRRNNDINNTSFHQNQKDNSQPLEFIDFDE